jgi:hypothetical protein
VKSQPTTTQQLLTLTPVVSTETFQAQYRVLEAFALFNAILRKHLFLIHSTWRHLTMTCSLGFPSLLNAHCTTTTSSRQHRRLGHPRHCNPVGECGSKQSEQAARAGHNTLAFTISRTPREGLRIRRQARTPRPPPVRAVRTHLRFTALHARLVARHHARQHTARARRAYPLDATHAQGGTSRPFASARTDGPCAGV